MTHANEKGFTLVEILVVMIIIGILVSLMAGNFVGTRLKARDSRRKNDITQIQRSLEAYYNDHNAYPASNASGQMVVGGTALAWGSSVFDSADAANTVYMATLPGDPSPASYRYVYVSDSSTKQKYQLFLYLENSQDNSVMSGIAQDCGNGVSKACNWGVSSSNTDLTTVLN